VAAPLSRQLRLLERAPSFRLLFLATLGSSVGTWLAAIALTIDVFDRTGSGKWVSALLVADFVPSIAVGLLLGSLVDRLARRRLMVGADLVRFAVFCYLPFAGSATAIVVAAAVVGLANGFFMPSVFAGLPNLVGDEELPYANSLLQVSDNVSYTIGPLLGGALVAASGPHLAYWINAVTFLVSAALLARIPAAALQAQPAASRGHLADLADGLRVVLRSRALLAVLVAWSIAGLGSSGVNVGEVVLAKVTFSAGAFGFGLLAAGSGVGLILGSALVATELERRGASMVYPSALALMAVGFGAAALSPNVWVAVACVVAAGIGNGAANVCNGVLIQRGAPDELRGRAFAIILSLNGAVRGLAMAGAGVLLDVWGARWLWGGSALLIAVAAVVGATLVPRRAGSALDTEPPGPSPDGSPRHGRRLRRRRDKAARAENASL
jgi:MFS family permease